MSELLRLAKRIDPRYIEKKPGKYEADYVSHGVVEQYLIGILGRVPQQEVVREIYDGEKLTGCILRLTLWIDGEQVRIEEGGAASNPMDETNGDRLKSAISDAYKRAAMRATVALHLWTGDGMYFLDKVLAREPSSDGVAPGAGAAPSESRPTGIVQELIDTYDYQTLQKICDAHGVKRLADLSPKELEAAKADLEAAVSASLERGEKS